MRYRAKQLSKINALRRTISQPDIHVVPILAKGKVLFVTAAEMHDEPASCANCIFYNEVHSTCQLIGPHVEIKKFTHGEPDKLIEFWPCCGMQTYGEPNKGEEKFLTETDPSELDLIWINAPEVGQKHGGATCGGANGADDCDYYQTDKIDKRKCPTGFCRVLQTTVSNGDVCTAWNDDDKVSWQEAQAILRKKESEAEEDE